MKILVPVLGFGKQGGYRVLSELANAWMRLGHGVTFLCPDCSPEPYFPTTAKILRCTRRGDIVEGQSLQKVTGLRNVVSLAFGLRAVCADYDVVLANHCLTVFPVFLSGARLRKRFYYIQAYEPDYFPWAVSPVKKLLAKLSYILPMRQIANSSTYSGYGLNPEVCLPPGVDLEVFSSRQALGEFILQKEIVVGTIGRWEPYKGTARAISAFRKAAVLFPQLKLKIGFGNVPPAEDYEIVPISGDSKLADFYRSLDILIVACEGQEGAPHYPVIEAMACGVPVIHTGYFPGNVSNSWMVRNGIDGDISQALISLISEDHSSVREKVDIARQFVEDHLSWEAVAIKFIACFEAEHKIDR